MTDNSNQEEPDGLLEALQRATRPNPLKDITGILQQLETPNTNN